ncbi:MAG: methyl-accepting chemotaxis protein [Desulfuromonadaceae bacterium]|nr:methyl-accepting chemotaxis protein [Desulfuromonadaceae bacterium]MDD2848895.1 methyl-accepting chemotaxis protein [Desulfuromonadaceae bacterium]MDD4132148.1 methyl-accepting chemotaxis protein [Desulfuromonadaceae bacterium]
MFKAFDNLSIRVKLVAAFLVVAVFSGVLGTVAIINVTTMKKADDFMYKEVALPLAELREITQAFLMNRIVTRAMITAADPDDREEAVDNIKENLDTMATLTAKYEKLLNRAEEKSAYAEFKGAYEAYQPLLKQMMDLSMDGKTAEAMIIAQGQASRQANLMMQALDKMSAVSVKHAGETAAANAAIAQKALIVSGVLALAAVLAAIAIGLIMSGRISTPLLRLRDSFQHVADGDLTIRVDSTSGDETGSLARSFTVMTEQLRELIAKVTATSSEVVASTRELQGTATEIATGAESAASQTISVATASEEMAATSNDISNSCQVAVESTQRASKAAQDGADVVRQTVEGMRKIAVRVQNTARTVDSLGARSDQIGAIVATIEDIADQTNLLALNAAIEAARAGDMGRGFAVVADEVRALAERTTKATREIGEMIKAIQSETRSAVAAMNEGVQEVQTGTSDAERSGTALQQILDEIDAVSNQVHQISTAAEEQSATTSEITDNIHRMTQNIQDTARGSHETAASASNLSNLAEGLQGAVARFQLH